MRVAVKNLIKKVIWFFGFQLIRKKDTLDFYLHEYESYEHYKEVQVFHNKRQLSSVWADEHTLTRVAKLVLVGPDSERAPVLGLCHGTRNGFEQNYLNSLDNRIFAIGTDISETATSFSNSVYWDFHEVNPDWIGAFDFVYTNSLDQSWNPRGALGVWLDQLRFGGKLVIEHTELHGPKGAGEMDPFGVRPAVMPYILTMWFGDKITIEHSVATKANNKLEAWLFVIKKTDPNFRFAEGVVQQQRV